MLAFSEKLKFRQNLLLAPPFRLPLRVDRLARHGKPRLALRADRPFKGVLQRVANWLRTGNCRSRDLWVSVGEDSADLVQAQFWVRVWQLQPIETKGPDHRF